MTIFAVFPGQGSQKIGMGTELFDNCPESREIFARADEALGFSISKICFEGPDSELVKTANTQPAILTVSIAAFEAWKARSPKAQSLTLMAGHSLGEYSALVAAGALEFEDAVRLVHLRGSYMQEAVPAGEGAMIAVLGTALDEIEGSLIALGEHNPSMVAIANDNAPGQVVLAGSRHGIDAFKELNSKKKIVELAVSAPFHCPLMQPAADRLKEKLKDISISKAKVPVIANYNAQPLTNPEDIREALYLQVCGRVRWTESVKLAASYGCVELIEFGQGNVLTGLAKRIEPNLSRSNIGTFKDLSE
jgi:[acyl-carrier-protein] S-malonyltransferase